MNRTPRFSKTLAHALRHAPEVYGLRLDDQGWVSVDELIAGLRKYKRQFEKITVDQIHIAVNSGNKKRYEIQDGKIRAMYGHSLVNRISLQSAVPPEILFHSTSERSWQKIQQGGLKPMSRQYVHLSSDQKIAREAGKRKGSEIVDLEIHALKAYRTGVNFYQASNDERAKMVWLADEVPEEFIVLFKQAHKKNRIGEA